MSIGMLGKYVYIYFLLVIYIYIKVILKKDYSSTGGLSCLEYILYSREVERSSLPFST